MAGSCFIDPAPNANVSAPWVANSGGLVGYTDSNTNLAWYYLNRIFQQNSLTLPGLLFSSNLVAAAGRYLGGQEITGVSQRNFWIDLQTSTIRDISDGTITSPLSINDSGDLALGGSESRIYTAASNTLSADLLAADGFTIFQINNSKASAGTKVVGVVNHGFSRSAAGVYVDLHPGTVGPAFSSNPGGSTGTSKGCINNAGHVVGNRGNAGVVTPWANLGGATFFIGAAAAGINKILINDSDLIAWDDTGTGHVFTYDGSLHDLGNLGVLQGLNNSGVLVGNNAAATNAWIYANGVFSNLIDKIPSAAGAGWTALQGVFDLSNDNFVAGFGIKNGVSTIFVAELCLTPTPPSPPPPPPPQPQPIPSPSVSPFIFPGSFCKNVNDCFPCFVLPTTNTSAEAQDIIQDFSIAWGNPQNNTPPLGSLFSSNGCVQVCQSVVSQTDADLCAARQQAACVIHHWDPMIQDPPVCLTPPTCAPVVPPVLPPPFRIFNSNTASCIAHCPDGLAFTFTVPAGQFVAVSQALADREAASFACREASLHRICMSLSPMEMCLGVSSPLNFTATGMFLDADANFWEIRSGSLPPGFSFVATLSGATLTIPGTPTTDGTFSFTMRVTAPNGDFMEKQFTVCVVAISPATLTDGTLGVPYAQTFTETTCAEQPINWTVVAGNLPNGLFLDNVTGIISGTPTVPGLFHFTIEATTGAP